MIAHDLNVIIVGGGFGGLRVAQGLGGTSVGVTLIDKRNFHLFQPLLYQVATGALSPANVATPLRSVMKRNRNVQVLLGEVTDIDLDRKQILLDQEWFAYDILVLATGATHQYFGHDDWREAAPGLKTIEEALDIRSRIFRAFEAAERESDPARIRALLNFVVVGGGPTGVELAGALREIANYTLRKEFRNINPVDAHVILIEQGEHVLPMYVPKLSAKAEALLKSLGVEVITGAAVTGIAPDTVTAMRNGQEEIIQASTVIWTAGVKASPIGMLLAANGNATLDRSGRIEVESDLSLPGHPGVYVIGDLACCKSDSGRPLPCVAPVAIQQGAHVVNEILARLHNGPPTSFQYRDYGSMATIGRAAAVVQLGRIRFSGYAAWLTWLFVHLMSLVRTENRFLVLLQWSWNYWTWNRSARIITEPGEVAHTEKP
ncbi:MAG: NAD(P)/FAD-dependent oxidoreductase [Candidatus Hydrogenedentes bacterium]|nr:NAD(P)/FAD-dependent oxidoreductase [Candidatus Hydrogenedentota bacterium]